MKPKERIIFDNYDKDVWEEEAREYFADFDGNENPSDDEVYRRACTYEEIDWEETFSNLCNFFEGKTLLCTADLGLWYGRRPGGKISNNFGELICSALKDCDYFKLWDENGHFYIEGSHHDGTNFYELKIITERGKMAYDSWNCGWSDKRTEREVHAAMMKSSKYTHLPRYAEKQFGCKRYEYEKEGTR